MSNAIDKQKQKPHFTETSYQSSDVDTATCLQYREHLKTPFSVKSKFMYLFALYTDCTNIESYETVQQTSEYQIQNKTYVHRTIY